MVGKWEFTDPRGLCSMTGRMQALCLLRYHRRVSDVLLPEVLSSDVLSVFPFQRKHVDDLAIGAVMIDVASSCSVSTWG